MGICWLLSLTYRHATTRWLPKGQKRSNGNLPRGYASSLTHIRLPSCSCSSSSLLIPPNAFFCSFCLCSFGIIPKSCGTSFGREDSMASLLPSITSHPFKSWNREAPRSQSSEKARSRVVSDISAVFHQPTNLRHSIIVTTTSAVAACLRREHSACIHINVDSDFIWRPVKLAFSGSTRTRFDL